MQQLICAWQSIGDQGRTEILHPKPAPKAEGGETQGRWDRANAAAYRCFAKHRRPREGGLGKATADGRWKKAGRPREGEPGTAAADRCFAKPRRPREGGPGAGTCKEEAPDADAVLRKDEDREHQQGVQLQVAGVDYGVQAVCLYEVDSGH